MHHLFILLKQDQFFLHHNLLFNVEHIDRFCTLLHLHPQPACDAEGEAFRGFISEGSSTAQNLEARVQTEGEVWTTRIMDYQQKLAEKLTVLNERGQGVLIRLNYIKKVRGMRAVTCVNYEEGTSIGQFFL